MGEKKKNDGEKNNKGGDNPNTVVLKMDLHCEGCVTKINKYLRGFQGVEKVVPENNSGKITITGKVDPTKVREKLAEKMKRKVELVSPQPKKEKENKEPKNENKSEKKTEDKKPKDKEPPVTTAVLKVALHCQGCVKRIGKTVSKTKGVHEMEIDKVKDLVTVKGAMDVKALAENLTQKLKRKVEVVPPKKDKEAGGGDKEGSGKKKNKGGGGGGEGGENEKQVEGGGKMEQNRMEYLAHPFGFGSGYGHGYVYGNVGGYNYGPVYPEHSHLHAPQMFSDENPNACSIM